MTLPTPAPVAAKIRRNSSVRRSLARAVYSLFMPIAMIHTGSAHGEQPPMRRPDAFGTGRNTSWKTNARHTPMAIATASAHINRCLSAIGSNDPTTASLTTGATPLRPVVGVDA